jgi:DNA-binding NarL/FixJ family response regulator
MIKIIIADDQRLVREGLKMYLQHEPGILIIGEAQNGREVLNLAGQEKPDVVITDIQMPEMDGIELTRELHAAYPEIKVIAVTVFRQDHLIVDMLEAGAKGYLLKDSEKEKLVEAIHAVYNNGRYFCESTDMKLIKKIAASEAALNPREPCASFSKIETDIIVLICQQLSSREIGNSLHLSPTTVENYRNRIYAKMAVKNVAGLVVYAVRHGMFKPWQNPSA